MHKVNEYAHKNGQGVYPIEISKNAYFYEFG